MSDEHGLYSYAPTFRLYECSCGKRFIDELSIEEHLLNERKRLVNMNELVGRWTDDL